jgi:hypothetical protein
MAPRLRKAQSLSSTNPADEVEFHHGKRLVVATEIGVDVGNSEETSRYDGSANIIPETIDIETTFERVGRQRRYTIWEDRLSELADHRKITGTAMFLETTAKTLLANWVNTQRSDYRLHQEGKKSL